MKFLVMIIGLPGSGKTTLAKKMQRNFLETPPIFEADMFFEKDGKYNWVAKLLGMAHKWCYEQVENTLKENRPVIVTNTFLTPKERKPYIKLAKQYDAPLIVITCNGQYESVHNVPKETIERMKKKFIPFSEDEKKI